MANGCVLCDTPQKNRVCVFIYCKCDVYGCLCVCVICLHPQQMRYELGRITIGFKQKYRIIYAIITQRPSIMNAQNRNEIRRERVRVCYYNVVSHLDDDDDVGRRIRPLIPLFPSRTGTGKMPRPPPRTHTHTQTCLYLIMTELRTQCLHAP